MTDPTLQERAATARAVADAFKEQMHRAQEQWEKAERQAIEAERRAAAAGVQLRAVPGRGQ